MELGNTYEMFLNEEIDSILLPNDDKEKILEDIDCFLKSDSKEWYETINGIPYRRGYLLYGPAGCGKSSFVKALANKIGLSLHIINLSSLDLDDTMLFEMIHSCRRSIILFEDIDSVFSSRDDDFEIVNRRYKKKGNHVTFSGILNVLDGIYAQEGNLIFMTTNHREKLDPSLVRSGRIDYELKFGYSNRECCEQLFTKFYGNCEFNSTDVDITQIGRQISESIPENTLSMAKIQGHFIKYRGHPTKALENISELTSISN